ncbi:CPBP family intramembrane glutamic endopeptidase [Leucobacter sp. W1478]|uniref:CPBP family intramembrane glutamic endopeptidase n=1 Tax=Leucobacter sp. W1478 TaxID=3439065 RepID=UPI003F332297
MSFEQQPPSGPQPQSTQPGMPPQPVQESQAPDAWGWAQGAAAPIHWEETEPLEYHRLLRGAPKYRWWKPLLALVLAFFYYVTFTVVFSVIVMVPYLLLSGAEFTEDTLLSIATPDTQQPISLVITLGSVALMIPAVWLAMLSTGLTPIGRAWSVALRIRWRLLFRTVIPAFVALAVMNIVGIGVELALAAVRGDATPILEAPPIDPTVALWSAAIILLLVPIQATAEELVFRGMFMQSLGAWFGGSRAAGAVGAFLRGPWIPIVVPSLIFGFAHIYDIWGWMVVVLLALVAGWLTWRTGGLEAAISIHVVNNWIAFGLMVLAIGGETKQTESGAGPGAIIGQIVGLGLYVWWVERIFVRKGGPRTRIDLVQSRRVIPQTPVPVPPQETP